MRESAYKQSGVDIHAASNLIERVKKPIRQTKRSGVMSDIGGFGALFDLKETGFKDPILVASTDGVGTKLKIATELDNHQTIGIDAVAMCVNDIVVQGAEPLFFLDYFATGKLVPDVAEMVIKSIAEGCQQAGCALIGGETAEMPGLYMVGDYDIAGFCVGAVERENIITGQNIQEGDVILGLSSNGLHSNGFSLVRRLVKEQTNFTFESPAPFDPALKLGELCLIPTRIYVSSILKALKIMSDNGKPAIKGMAHITGGGLKENIPRILPEGLSAVIEGGSWTMPSIFKWLKDVGNLENEDMIETLNCGIGMALICDKKFAEKISTALKEQGESVYEIGNIEKASSNNPAPFHINNPEKLWI